jgi:hypothetical protein
MSGCAVVVITGHSVVVSLDLEELDALDSSNHGRRIGYVFS